MVGELSDMWVEHEVRRMGVGEKLLRLAIEWLRQQNVYSVEAQILSGNEPILKLVRSLGMKDELHQMRLTWEDYDRTELGDRAMPGGQTQSGEESSRPPEQNA
jgi:GNAT superfamily N-acetyltransferase